MRQTVVQIVAGVLVALLGLLWILQGLDLLGQDGGMNDQFGWAIAGVVVLVGGLALLAGGLRGWRRRGR
jgi:hypothetical protein